MVRQRQLYSDVVNNDWWRGEAQSGQKGIFPSNYVRKLEPNEKSLAPPAPAPYQYPGQYQPAPYQPPMAQQQQPMPVQEAPAQEGQKSSKLGQFGKNYGKTFVNATAWGGGMALGADVINSIF
jgi:LAS seventeen-binding protein 1/2